MVINYFSKDVYQMDKKQKYFFTFHYDIIVGKNSVKETAAYFFVVSGIAVLGGGGGVAPGVEVEGV